MTELAAARADDGTWVFDVVTAAASIPVRPPASWFADPGLDEPTALTVTADGRVYGHACTWFSRHVGLPGHVTPPRSKSGYREYLSGQVETDDGSMVATGRITLGGGHAGLGGDLVAAQQHYDDVSYAVADVQCGEDSVGLWIAGALRPDVTPEQIRTLRASSVSGDWRHVDGNMALCAVHAVNVPGFSTPRANVAASGALTSLVAAGMVAPRPDPQETPMPDTDTPESLTAASPNPFAKNEPAPPSGDDDEGDSAGSGEAMKISGTNIIVQVTGETDDGEIVFEGVLPSEALERADEAMAASAAQHFTYWMQDRARDAKLGKQGTSIDKLTELVTSLAASAQSTNEKVDELLTKDRAAEFDRLVASAELD